MLKTVVQVLIPLLLAVLLGLLLAARFLPDHFGSLAGAFGAERAEVAKALERLAHPAGRAPKTAPAPKTGSPSGAEPGSAGAGTPDKK